MEQQALIEADWLRFDKKTDDGNYVSSNAAFHSHLYEKWHCKINRKKKSILKIKYILFTLYLFASVNMAFGSSKSLPVNS